MMSESFFFSSSSLSCFSLFLSLILSEARFWSAAWMLRGNRFETSSRVQTPESFNAQKIGRRKNEEEKMSSGRHKAVVTRNSFPYFVISLSVRQPRSVSTSELTRLPQREAPHHRLSAAKDKSRKHFSSPSYNSFGRRKLSQSISKSAADQFSLLFFFQKSNTTTNQTK